MTSDSLFSIRKQLTFYGAYHNHPINILVHVICVPIILWTFLVMGCSFPTSSFLPKYHIGLGDYLAFDLNGTSIVAILYLFYYFTLEPTAALLYTPQLTLSLLSAIAFSYRPGAFGTAACVNAVCWIVQFFGHGVAEKRAPALLDNLIGALVLAPFFVHFEILFKLGYRPQLQRELQHDIDVEISKIHKQEALKN